MCPSRAAAAPSVDTDELARFAALADQWWDSDGELKALHRLNPVRLAYSRDHLVEHFAARLGATTDLKPLAGLRLLDVGCGGGIFAEPLCRLGAQVVGLDAGAEAVGVARHHAEATGLAIDYRQASAEELAAGGEQFDAVLVMEVIEHVADVGAFLAAVGQLVAPGGAFIGATLNRTVKSWALAVVGAEYVLGWVPRGTHQWDRFVKPSELARHFRPAGIELSDLSGVVYDPLSGNWRLGRDLAVNYLAFGTKRETL
ncbi:MAG TPA: bifunctional 2-polyprenyl-6-hydroxyphenol methylase/3-demethylubiquinol 3-O-methyltransferase UbiG [Alphaproteobacteria bacterium]|nr:bifunctional 2-polyprenyl-6-hydroxyphenol methylase/3-demethylubiquinol 3-O-methyltransferase UbiG [Alphaproteobacteria bacterium]